jgi:hypothetical protein
MLASSSTRGGVQHVSVTEGGPAIVGNVSTSAPGGRAKTQRIKPHALGYALSVEMPRQIEAERATGALVGRVLNARHWWRCSQGNKNARKHGEFTAEALALEIQALARMTRKTIAVGGTSPNWPIFRRVNAVIANDSSARPPSCPSSGPDRSPAWPPGS